MIIAAKNWQLLDSLTAKIEANEQLSSVSSHFESNQFVQKITREIFALLEVPFDTTEQLSPDNLVAALKGFKSKHVRDHRLLLSKGNDLNIFETNN